MKNASRSERRTLIAILLLAMVQGIIYFWLLPPWQHYEEPTHLEYALLLAELNRRPTVADEDQAMRETIFHSMVEHGFYRHLGGPPTLQDDRPVPLGFSVLDQPPAYYALVSLPLRLVDDLSIETQLYTARSVSLVLFLLTIGVAIGLIRDLTPAGHVLRWAVPVTLALLAPFVDVMTSVNSDVGAAFATSLLLWGAVRAIRYGLTWQRAIWIVATALLALLTKNTAVIVVVVAPVALLVALWAQRGWQWRWLVAGSLGSGLLLLLLLFSFDDAALWYRWHFTDTLRTSTRVATPLAPVGEHALMLEAQPGQPGPRILTPLLNKDWQRLAGKTITVGGWLWADRPATVPSPALGVPTQPARFRTLEHQQVEVTSEPSFVAWTFEVPVQITALHYIFFIRTVPESEPPLRVFLDGAVVAEGSRPTSEPPVFDDSSGQSGMWGGQRFSNPVRNGSAEQPWPRLNPRIAATIDGSISLGSGRTPSLMLSTLLDVERTSGLVLGYLGLIPFDTLFTGMAWGHIRLEGDSWAFLWRGTLLLALAGSLRWWWGRWHTSGLPGLYPALLVLALMFVLVWGNVLTRSLPLINTGIAWPMARYTYPAIVPTVLLLVGGWWALWPRRWREYATEWLVGGILLLNIANLANTWMFYYG